MKTNILLPFTFQCSENCFILLNQIFRFTILRLNERIGALTIDPREVWSHLSNGWPSSEERERKEGENHNSSIIFFWISLIGVAGSLQSTQYAKFEVQRVEIQFARDYYHWHCWYWFVLCMFQKMTEDFTVFWHEM